MRLLERYVLLQLIRPFFLGVFVVTFLLTMDFLFDYLDLFLNKGVPLFTVLWLFVLGLGWMLALSVPCGVLVGVLMTYGRLAQDNEIVALRASGVNLLRPIVPAVVIGVLVASGLILFNNYVLPDMNHAFANLMLDINRKRPTAEIREGVFLDGFSGYNLWIGNLDDRSGRMEDVLIYDFSRKNEPPRTILARRGRLEFDLETSILTLHLEDGEIHETDADKGPLYRKLDFARQSMNIQGVAEALQRTEGRSRGQREMSVGAMNERIAELLNELVRHKTVVSEAVAELGLEDADQLPGPKPRRPWYAPLAAPLGLHRSSPPAPPDSFWTNDRRRIAEQAQVHRSQADAALKKINQYRVEIHKKFSIPVAAIVFALVGAPLGIRARRGGLAAGFFSVVFFVFYYLCLIGGEQLADRRYLAPWLAMWLPNVVLGILGLVLTLRVAEMFGVRSAAGPVGKRTC